MSITMSLGRAAPEQFNRKVNKKLYQGFNGGGASGFRGYHDTSRSILDQAIDRTLNQNHPEGVLLVDPTKVDGSLGPADPAPDLNDQVTEKLGLPAGLKVVSMARVALLGVGAAKVGGVVGLVLAALAIPDMLILYRSVTGNANGVPSPTKGPSIPLNGYGWRL